MSAPEPTAVERVVAAVESILSDFDTVMNVRAESRDVTQAVVAAIRAMSPQQQAELCSAVAQAWDEGYGAARIDLWQWTLSARDKPPQVHDAAVNPYRSEVAR